MKVFNRRQCRDGWPFKVFRGIVRVFVAMALLIAAAAVFLRIHGVPGPLLREIVRRANAAGIPVEIDAVKPSLNGWRAVNVRYYSRNPDDLEAVVQADEVFFKQSAKHGGVAVGRWKFDLVAMGVSVAPSVEWGVEFPEGSAFGKIGRAGFSVAFEPDRIAITEGRMSWMGIQLSIDGTVLKRRKDRPWLSVQKTVSPVFIDGDHVARFERWLKTLELHGETGVDIDFTVDANDYAASRIECRAHAGALELRDVGFSGADLSVRYAFPRVELEHVGLYKDNQSFQMEGWYDLEGDQSEIKLSSAISSPQLLLLLPRRLMSLVSRAGVRIGALPQMDLHFGPETPSNLHRQVDGSFVLRDAVYRGLEIASLKGTVERRGDRLELGQLKGTVLGQEARATEFGSCLAGGEVSGEVYWDSSSRMFGVEMEGNLDPNLLLEPLWFSRTATNAIRRFKFDGKPPQVWLELGACYEDWKTFFIKVQGSSTDVRLHGVPFSSLGATARYRQGVLDIDPMVARQGTEYFKGSATLDFHRDQVFFDAGGTLSPQVLQDAVCPGVKLFGETLKTSGPSKITACGCVDWGRMRATAFEAKVELGHVELPVAKLDRVSAGVSAKGTVVNVSDAVFDLYGGSGKGAVSFVLDPAEKGIPYQAEVEIDAVDFRKCIEFVQPDAVYDISGKMSGNAKVEADFTRGFFDAASGRGRIKVADGQLADLPLFSGFSKVIRKIIPSFKIFSINRLTGDFELKDGVLHSGNAYFDGDLISAKGKGSYSMEKGLDAYVQVQILSDNRFSRVFRWLTDPIFKFFELKLEGTLSNPEWRIEKLSGAEPSGGNKRQGGESE